MSRRRLVPLAALLLALGGCYASNVVEPGQRSVQVEQVQLAWRPAAAEDLAGFWSSTEVTGSLAGGLLRAYYWFDPAGAYSGAALVVDDGRVRFMTLAEDGRWSLDEAGLDLHDGSGALTAALAPGAPDHLRLTTPDSAIVFQRVPLE